MAIQSQNTLLRLTFLFKTLFFLNRRLQYNVINFCEKLYSKWSRTLNLVNWFEGSWSCRSGLTENYKRIHPIKKHRGSYYIWCLLVNTVIDLDGLVTTFHVTVRDDNSIAVSLEASDIMSPSSVYVVKITGESKNYFFEFEEFNSTLPPPIIFKANYHGLYYIITLVVVNGNVVTKPSRSITVLTSKHHM